MPTQAHCWDPALPTMGTALCLSFSGRLNQYLSVARFVFRPSASEICNTFLPSLPRGSQGISCGLYPLLSNRWPQQVDTRLKELSQDATLCCRSAGLHLSLPPFFLPPSLSVCLSHALAAMWATRVGIWLPLTSGFGSRELFLWSPTLGVQGGW